MTTPRARRAPAPKAETRESPLFIQSLEKGVAVLLAFGPRNETMNLGEIAAATGIGKSAAQRFAYTLEALGYLRKDPVTRRYSLTVATLAMGYRYLLVNRTVERANAFLLDLNRACKETVNFSEPDGTDMVYVGRFPTSRTTPVHMPLGRRLPMYCTSSGRAYLSCLPPEERERVLRASNRVAYTRSTVTSLPRLRDICEKAAISGYACAESEYYAGDLNVGAAVVDSEGRPIGAVNISVPSTRWTLEDMKRELAPLVIQTARLISTRQPNSAQLEPFWVGFGRAASKQIAQHLAPARRERSPTKP
jgi:IclR family transcriptional regulator, pca regulon regulatory protein